MTLSKDLQPCAATLGPWIIRAQWLLLLILLAGCGKSLEEEIAEAAAKARAEAESQSEISRAAIHADLERRSRESRLNSAAMYFESFRQLRWMRFVNKQFSAEDLGTLKQAERSIDHALQLHSENVDYCLAVYKVAQVYHDKIEIDGWQASVSWLNVTLAYSPSTLVTMYGEK